MEKITIFDKVSLFKEKIFSFFQHRRKVTALENYSSCAPFQHRSHLSLLKKCLAQAFLDKEEATFLDHMLLKYQVNYLDWGFKTRWLRNEMSQRRQIAQERVRVPQFSFNFEKAATTPVQVPVEILATRNVSRPMRRV
jgi:hypothetical protein